MGTNRPTLKCPPTTSKHQFSPPGWSFSGYRVSQRQLAMITMNNIALISLAIGLHNHSVGPSCFSIFFSSIIFLLDAVVKVETTHHYRQSSIYSPLIQNRPPVEEPRAERASATACLINYIIWINLKIIPVALLSNDLLPFTTHFSIAGRVSHFRARFCHAGLLVAQTSLIVIHCIPLHIDGLHDSVVGCCLVAVIKSQFFRVKLVGHATTKLLLHTAETETFTCCIYTGDGRKRDARLAGWLCCSYTANFQFNLAPFSERTRLPCAVVTFPARQNPVHVRRRRRRR